MLCTVFYFILFWSLSSNNELQLELLQRAASSVLFIECCICLSQQQLVTIVIYVALSWCLSLSLCETRCTAFQQVALLQRAELSARNVFWCGLHFWNCASLCCRRSLKLLLSVLISQWGKHTVGDGAHSGQIFMLSFIIVFIFFVFLLLLPPAAELFVVAICLVCVCFFYGFTALSCIFFLHAPQPPSTTRRRRQVQGCAFVALSAWKAAGIKLENNIQICSSFYFFFFLKPQMPCKKKENISLLIKAGKKIEEEERAQERKITAKEMRTMFSY